MRRNHHCERVKLVSAIGSETRCNTFFTKFRWDTKDYTQNKLKYYPC